MNNNEIANKVAVLLGWVKSGGVWCKPLHTGWVEPMEEYNKGITDIIFSWQTIGLIIEKMESLGWDIILNGSCAHFRRKENDRPDVINLTVGYPIQHGYHVAICLAFIEAMAIIEKGKK